MTSYEKLLRTTQHKKCNEASLAMVKGETGPEEMCAKRAVGIRCVLSLCHHFTAIVSGPMGCGKTAWVLRLIDNIQEKIEPVPSRIWYYYGEYQLAFNNYASVYMHSLLYQKKISLHLSDSAITRLVSKNQLIVVSKKTQQKHHRICLSTLHVVWQSKYATTSATDQSERTTVCLLTSAAGQSSLSPCSYVQNKKFSKNFNLRKIVPYFVICWDLGLGVGPRVRPRVRLSA